ncbi:protein phosphatase inhibitor 2 isoform X1 [Brassica rapa]|uniref:Protein phosphatase inhibitor 2 n=1 Tax=Brassica campestris TaxID=3711 RepID=M4EK16_BRACM|nr:protein phosphatase inhibitor 2 isoform X1 [Brassica rapa]
MTDPEKKGRVQWDEANIVEIESNKPVRQKITEPKTPYHPMIHDDDDDEGSLSPRGGRSFNECVDDMQRAEDLRNVLNGEAVSSGKGSGSGGGGWSSAEDEEADPLDDEGLEGEKNERFSELRRVHYDEFHKVKELRSLGSFYEEEEEGEDDGASKAETTTSPHSEGGVNKEVEAARKSSSSSS